MKHKKTAAVFWAAGSVLFIITIITYVTAYSPSNGSVAEKTQGLIDQWPLVSTIWRLETLAAVLLTISSVYFAIDRKNIFWILVAFAHVLMTGMYVYMLGGYPRAASAYAEAPFLFPIINDMAIWLFALSNSLFLMGLAGIYYTDSILKRWLSLPAFFISLIGAAGGLALFVEWISFSQLNLMGPLILILYAVNAWWGMKVAGNS